jgi:hypothetical protein
MAEGAVLGEPFSAMISLLNRENTGNSRRKHRQRVQRSSLNGLYSNPFHANSLLGETGNFLNGPGNVWPRTGNARPPVESLGHKEPHQFHVIQHQERSSDVSSHASSDGVFNRDSKNNRNGNATHHDDHRQRLRIIRTDMPALLATNSARRMTTPSPRRACLPSSCIKGASLL